MPTTAPRPAKPTKEIFDPFHSSATGHQRDKNVLSGSTSWRDSRTLKLREQFGSGGGGKRISDTVGAGSLNFRKDGQKKNVFTTAPAMPRGQRSILESLQAEKDVERPTKRLKTEKSMSERTYVGNAFTPLENERDSTQQTSITTVDSSPSRLLSPIDPNRSMARTESGTISGDDDDDAPSHERPCPQIFAQLNIYINGSTAPLVSDHKLKQILTEHGAGISVALGRRTVTHVVIGRSSSSGGSGGGLCGSKIEKEVTRRGGNAVKYVTADWVIESVRAGKRLPESKFEALSLAPKGVSRITTMFGTKEQEGLGDFTTHGHFATRRKA